MSTDRILAGIMAFAVAFSGAALLWRTWDDLPRVAPVSDQAPPPTTSTTAPLPIAARLVPPGNGNLPAVEAPPRMTR